MKVIEPRTENEILTEQERTAIRALIEKGCDPSAVVDLFGLEDGELCEICK